MSVFGLLNCCGVCLLICLGSSSCTSCTSCDCSFTSTVLKVGLGIILTFAFGFA